MKTSNDIKGWLHYRDFYDMLLGILPEGGRVVEVGVFYGKGLIHLAQNQGGKGLNIYGVDAFRLRYDLSPYQDRDVQADEDFYEKCVGNLFAAEVERQVTLISLPSVRASALFEDGSMDCVFIDAAHDEASVIEDIKAWRPKVKPGGILAGDDYVPELEGVIPAVDKMVPDRKLMGPAWYTTV